MYSEISFKTVQQHREREAIDYKQFAHTLLVILAQKLSIVPRFTRQTSHTWRKVVVSLSSASLVNKKMLAKTK